MEFTDGSDLRLPHDQSCDATPSAPGGSERLCDERVAWASQAGGDRRYGVVTIAGAVPVGAQEAWRRTHDLSAPGRHAVDPQVAVDADGNATVVWLRRVGGRRVVQAAHRPAGRRWGEPMVVSGLVDEAADPRIAMDGAGNATALWVSHRGGRTRVRAAYRPAGGSWQAPVDLSRRRCGNPPSSVRDPQIAVAGDGETMAVWLVDEVPADPIEDLGKVQAANRAPNGRWQAAVNLRQLRNCRARDAQIAVASGGSATAVWSERSSNPDVDIRTVRVWAARRAPGGGWGRPRGLSFAFARRAVTPEPRVAVDANGGSAVVWRYREKGGSRYVAAAAAPAGQGWSSVPFTLSDFGKARNPHVAIASSEDAAVVHATVVWQRLSDDRRNRVVEAADVSMNSGGAGWVTTRLSHSLADPYRPRVAADGGGVATAVWLQDEADGTAVVAARGRATSIWRRPVDVSAASGVVRDPGVAAAGAGAVAVWRRHVGRHYIVQAASR